MKINNTLIIFACVLILSTATSFTGYKYLSLASEYRSRNFTHLNNSQKLIEILKFRPELTLAETQEARTHIKAARDQAEWCTENLTSLERQVFRILGAQTALDLCRSKVRVSDRALRITQSANESEGSRTSEIS